MTADGAHDTRRCHKAIIERDAVPIIPIRRNGRLWKDDCPAARACNETLRATRCYGRAYWKRWSLFEAGAAQRSPYRAIRDSGLGAQISPSPEVRRRALRQPTASPVAGLPSPAAP